MLLGRYGATAAVVIGEEQHQITATITAVVVIGEEQHQITAPAISIGRSSSRCALAGAPRPFAFRPLLLSLTPPRAARPMSSTSSPSPPSERRGEEEAPKEEQREGAPSSDSPPPAAPDLPATVAPLPPPPEAPSPGDCCGSGCVRCVWDIYYDELEAYNKLVAERRPQAKKVD